MCQLLKDGSLYPVATVVERLGRKSYLYSPLPRALSFLGLFWSSSRAPWLWCRCPRRCSGARPTSSRARREPCWWRASRSHNRVAWTDTARRSATSGAGTGPPRRGRCGRSGWREGAALSRHLNHFKKIQRGFFFFLKASQFPRTFWSFILGKTATIFSSVQSSLCQERAAVKCGWEDRKKTF